MVLVVYGFNDERRLEGSRFMGGAGWDTPGGASPERGGKSPHGEAPVTDGFGVT